MASKELPKSAIYLRDARKRAGLTQQELADKLGITKTSIRNYEHGISYPKAENLYGLFEVLHINARDFFANE